MSLKEIKEEFYKRQYQCRKIYRYTFLIRMLNIKPLNKWIVKWLSKKYLPCTLAECIVPTCMFLYTDMVLLFNAIVDYPGKCPQEEFKDIRTTINKVRKLSTDEIDHTLTYRPVFSNILQQCMVDEDCFNKYFERFQSKDPLVILDILHNGKVLNKVNYVRLLSKYHWIYEEMDKKCEEMDIEGLNLDNLFLDIFNPNET